jgi:hypothetical protein
MESGGEDKSYGLDSIFGADLPGQLDIPEKPSDQNEDVESDNDEYPETDDAIISDIAHKTEDEDDILNPRHMKNEVYRVVFDLYATTGISHEYLHSILGQHLYGYQ